MAGEAAAAAAKMAAVVSAAAHSWGALFVSYQDAASTRGFLCMHAGG